MWPVIYLSTRIYGHRHAREHDAVEATYKALADRTRLRILALLMDGEVCVCDIHDTLRLPQPTASRHLAYLRRSGSRRGAARRYLDALPVGRCRPSGERGGSTRGSRDVARQRCHERSPSVRELLRPHADRCRRAACAVLRGMTEMDQPLDARAVVAEAMGTSFLLAAVVGAASWASVSPAETSRSRYWRILLPPERHWPRSFWPAGRSPARTSTRS